MYNMNKRKNIIYIITMFNTTCTKRSNISIQIKNKSLIKHEHAYKGIITTWKKSLRQQHNSLEIKIEIIVVVILMHFVT
jgi:hypothetical protein